VINLILMILLISVVSGQQQPLTEGTNHESPRLIGPEKMDVADGLPDLIYQ
jgi:hypothetical protein